MQHADNISNNTERRFFLKGSHLFNSRKAKISAFPIKELTCIKKGNK